MKELSKKDSDIIDKIDAFIKIRNQICHILSLTESYGFRNTHHVLEIATYCILDDLKVETQENGSDENLVNSFKN